MTTQAAGLQRQHGEHQQSSLHQQRRAITPPRLQRTAANKQPAEGRARDKAQQHQQQVHQLSQRQAGQPSPQQCRGACQMRHSLMAEPQQSDGIDHAGHQREGKGANLNPWWQSGNHLLAPR